MKTQNKYLNKKYSLLLIILCFVTYMFSYAGKYNYSANINLIIEHFKVSHADAGLVTTLFFIAYGVGQFVHGALCKHYKERYVIPGVLLCSAIMNFTFTQVDNFTYIYIIWFLNGCALAVLWPTLSGCLLRNIHVSKRKNAMYAMGVSTPVGILLIYGLSSIFSLFNNLNISFYFSSVALVAVAVLWFVLYGHIKKEKNYEEYVDSQEEIVKKKDESLILLTGPVLFMVFGIICIVLNQFEREGLTSWTPAIMAEMFGKDNSISIICALVLPLIAILSPFIIELISKKIKGLYSKLVLIIGIASIFCALIIVCLNKSSFAGTLIFFILAYLVFSMIDNLISSRAPIILKDKYDAGLITGFLNGFAYVGSAISTYLIGLVVDKTGWVSVFILYVCLLVAVFIFVTIIFVMEKSKAKKLEK